MTEQVEREKTQPLSVELFLRKAVERETDPNKKAIFEKMLSELDGLKMYDFREIGDHLYDGIYIADGEGKTLYVNKAYSRITGIQSEEVVGYYVEDLVKQGLYNNAVTPMVLETKKPVNSIGEGSYTQTKMLITGSPIFDEDGNIKKVVVVDRDMTDLFEIKSELEATLKKIKTVEEDQEKKDRELEVLRRSSQKKENLIGKSLAMQQLIYHIDHVASLDTTILIVGETGVGKEVVSNELFQRSQRKDKPFIKVNCAAIPASLLESELFGYEKGAFTGAKNSTKLGLFELADEGTILLDEIGEMPLELQSKLLRVVQHKEVMRIGGNKPVKLNVRILAATNCDLEELIKQGKFRQDLYYRLNVFPIQIPPLRERKEDIEPLARFFLEIYNTKYGKDLLLSKAGLELLERYSWPGNIRELQNVVERIVIISLPSGDDALEYLRGLLNVSNGGTTLSIEEVGLKKIVEDVERRTIERVLADCGSTRKAAKVLQVDQSTIVKKAKKLGISLSDDK